MNLLPLKGRVAALCVVGLEYERPRPPCKHIQDMTEHGMPRALKRHGGICAWVVEGGCIRARDEIVVL